MTVIRVPKGIGRGAALVRRTTRSARLPGRFLRMRMSDALPPTFRRRRPAVLALTALLLAAGGCVPPSGGETAPTPAAAVEPRTAREVIEEMRLRWAESWPRAVEARVETTIYGVGAEQRQSWTQYYRVPGALRVEHGPRSARNGLLYLNGQVHAYQDGRRTASAAQQDPLLVAGFDVHVQSVDSSLASLSALGIDTTRMHRTAVDGTLTFVVGTATRGDTLSPQLWVEADRWLARRVLEARTVGTRRILTETRIVERRPVNGVPFPAEVLRLRDGRPTLREEWTSARVLPTISNSLFDPETWGTAAAPPPGGA